MKTTINGMTRAIGALAFLLVLCLSQTAFAASPPKGVEADGECTIYQSGWDHTSGSAGISLRSALYYANKKDAHYECYKSITLESDVFVTSPVIINSPAKGLTIDGNGRSLNFSKWSSNATDGDTGGDAGEECAIYVNAPNVTIKDLDIVGDSKVGRKGICFIRNDGSLEQVTVTDFNSTNKEAVYVRGTGSTLNGVTVMDSGHGVVVDASSVTLTDITIDTVKGAGVKLLGNNAILDDVKVNSAGETGLFFGEGVTGNKVMPNCQLQSAKVGIHDKSSKSNSTTNIVLMTNRVGAVNYDGYDDVTPEGILIWEAQTNVQNISVSADVLLKSVKEVTPIVTEVRQIGTSQRYKVEGFLAEVPGIGEESFGQISCQNLTKDKSVPRLAVFMVSDTQMVFAGVVGNSAGVGVRGKTGEFKFYIDSAAEGQELMSGSKFVLIPVSSDWEIMGRASNYKLLANGQNDCTDVASSGVGDDAWDTSFDSSRLIEWFTTQQCSIANDMMGGTVDPTMDSDMDGIPDFLEMCIMKKNGVWVFDPTDCRCDCNNTLTCWYRPDSDYDGIKDGKDGYNFLNASPQFYAYRQYLHPDYQGEHGQVIGQMLVLDPQPTDTDGDGKPDCQDRDSDGDGLLDGWEDRSRVFNPHARAYWRYMGGTIGNTYYPEGPGEQYAGTKVECTEALRDDPDNGFDNGIMYGIYVVSGTGEHYLSEPVQASIFNLGQILVPGTGRKLMPMACVNDSVSAETNFNGVYDLGYGETDARSPDTDGDCVCDGDGPGCAAIDNMPASAWDGYATCLDFHNGVPTMNNPKWLNDRCPETPHHDNNCTPLCVPGEILRYVAQHADPIFWEEVGSNEIKLVDSNNSGVPDLFEQTTEICDEELGECIEVIDWQLIHDSCPDIDKDGIPDCVERWSWDCNQNTLQTIGLDPYKRDTDGDGLIDGMGMGDMPSDVCPFTPGVSDLFNEVNPNYSCNPREVYSGGGKALQVLSCFLDRDGDGVRDCLEDKNQDGKVAAPISGLAGILRSESDPLKVDTDGDGLTDYEEFYGWPYRTNPALADTDGDGLSDLEEDLDGDRYITLVDRTGMKCVGVGMFDTDPRRADTDGDGLSDYMELKGPILTEQHFRALISDPNVWLQGGIPHASDPNAADSDGDGLIDSEEYDGSNITYWGSNPCMVDSDGDGIHDADELPGCRLNPSPHCVGSPDPNTSAGVDTDGDGLSDLCEMQLGTDPLNPDTDNDGVWDGAEVNYNCFYEPHMGDTDPLNPDTDGDGLMDGMELRYGTDPTNPDTDGDCIPDGLEDANRNGIYDAGKETNALSWDTDGDGLPDGWIPSMGMGEDLNCNGIRDMDEFGNWLETDPRMWDSSGDGRSDYEMMTWGRHGFSLANLHRATTPQTGCSMVGGAGGSPAGMLYMLGVVLAAVRALAMKRRKASA